MTEDPDYKENGFVNELDPFLEGTTHYEVYKLLYDIVKDGLCEEKPEESDWEQSKAMLNEGKIGCMAIVFWAIKQMQSAGNNPDAIGSMPFPNEVNRYADRKSADYAQKIYRGEYHVESAGAVGIFRSYYHNGCYSGETACKLGHLGGDEALKLLAGTMKQVFGNKVILGRYGGDEFVIWFYGKIWKQQK